MSSGEVAGGSNASTRPTASPDLQDIGDKTAFKVGTPRQWGAFLGSSV